MRLFSKEKPVVDKIQLLIFNINHILGGKVAKKETLTKEQRKTLEEKISSLSEIEEAYVLGFIEGASYNEEKQTGTQKPVRRTTKQKRTKGA